MDNENDYYFSGGVFFSLINAIRGNSRRTNNPSNDKIKLSNNELMLGFYELFTGKTLSIDTYSSSSFSVQVSKYINCNANSAGEVPFANTNVVDGLIREVENCYNVPLLRTINFIDSFLADDDQKRIQFIKNVMQILRDDKSIQNGDKFYVKRNGEPIRKNEVLKMRTIEFDPFVLGILHYVLKTHKNNTKGKSLIDALVYEPYEINDDPDSSGKEDKKDGRKNQRTKKRIVKFDQEIRRKFVIIKLKPEDISTNDDNKDIPADDPIDNRSDIETQNTGISAAEQPDAEVIDPNAADNSDKSESPHTYKEYSIEAMIKNIKAPSDSFPYVCLSGLPSQFKCVDLNTEPERLNDSGFDKNTVYRLSADFDFEPDYSSEQYFVSAVPGKTKLQGNISFQDWEAAGIETNILLNSPCQFTSVFKVLNINDNICTVEWIMFKTTYIYPQFTEKYTMGKRLAEENLFGHNDPDIKYVNTGELSRDNIRIPLESVSYVNTDPQSLCETAKGYILFRHKGEDAFINDSYMRMGYLAYSGPLGNAVFSAALSRKYSGLKYLYNGNTDFVSDISSCSKNIYDNDSFRDSIYEWRDIITNYSNEFDINIYLEYDECDFLQTYQEQLKDANAYSKVLYLLIQSYICSCAEYTNLTAVSLSLLYIAITAYAVSDYYLSYALLLKCRSICCNDTDILKTIDEYENRINKKGNLSPEIAGLIKRCIYLELPQILWIMYDLKAVPINKIDFDAFKV